MIIYFWEGDTALNWGEEFSKIIKADSFLFAIDLAAKNIFYVGF